MAEVHRARSGRDKSSPPRAELRDRGGRAALQPVRVVQEDCPTHVSSYASAPNGHVPAQRPDGSVGIPDRKAQQVATAPGRTRKPNPADVLAVDEAEGGADGSRARPEAQRRVRATRRGRGDDERPTGAATRDDGRYQSDLKLRLRRPIAGFGRCPGLRGRGWGRRSRRWRCGWGRRGRGRLCLGGRARRRRRNRGQRRQRRHRRGDADARQDAVGRVGLCGGRQQEGRSDPGGQEHSEDCEPKGSGRGQGNDFFRQQLGRTHFRPAGTLRPTPRR